MPKQNWTDEDRQAFGAKMKAARAAKQQDKEIKQEIEEAPAVDTAEVVRQVLAEIMKGGAKDNTSDRTTQDYSVEKDDYPDPRPELRKLPELKKYAFDENYILEWDVEVANYPKADGRWYREPRFVLDLWRYPTSVELADAQEKGNTKLTPTTQLWVGKHMQSEDDVAAKTAANKLGLKVGKDFPDFDTLMDAMRIERMKQWLLSLPVFGGEVTPSAAPQFSEMAVSGRVVKVHNQGTQDQVVESEKIIRA